MVVLISIGTEGVFFYCVLVFLCLLRTRDKKKKILIIFPRPICPSQIKTHVAITIAVTSFLVIYIVIQPMCYMAVFITVSRQSYLIKKQQNEIWLSSR